jgi:hypothetical protein
LPRQENPDKRCSLFKTMASAGSTGAAAALLRDEGYE